MNVLIILHSFYVIPIIKPIQHTLFYHKNTEYNKKFQRNTKSNRLRINVLMNKPERFVTSFDMSKRYNLFRVPRLFFASVEIQFLT